MINSLLPSAEEWLKYATKQICIVDAVTENKNLCNSAPDDPFTTEALCLEIYIYRFSIQRSSNIPLFCSVDDVGWSTYH